MSDVTEPIVSSLYTESPGWFVEADAVVVGSGVAGLTCALKLREQLDHVVLVTKTRMSSGSTVWAQGGIAVALGATDSPEAHSRDTLLAGVGLCDERAVEILVSEGPARVRELIAMGARFDRNADGDISLTREGGHRTDRIAHAGGDATGREISRALIAALTAVMDDPGIEVLEHAMVVDLLTTERTTRNPRGTIAGVSLHVIGEGSRSGVGAILAPAVVLATGGIGQVYTSTTNPPEATGDGSAAALRAGAELVDIEFVQFHPTVMWLGSGSKGQQPLISEAVRGEGAILLDADGTRFMPDLHELAELAPRDVVAKAMIRQMDLTESDHVLLDARHLGKDFLKQRFPGIYARVAELGLDMADELIPVRPAQHYHSGGVAVDVWSRSTLPGLYAIGETACTGVHGANRLASNSLLEGLVYADRAARDILRANAAGELTRGEPVTRPNGGGLIPAAKRGKIQRAATDGPGVTRHAEGMARTAKRLDALGALSPCDVPSVAEWETTNLHQLALALNESARRREETRGGHDRSDFPMRNDDTWRGSHHVWLSEEGELCVEFRAKKA